MCVLNMDDKTEKVANCLRQNNFFFLNQGGGPIFAGVTACARCAHACVRARALPYVQVGNKGHIFRVKIPARNIDVF